MRNRGVGGTTFSSERISFATSTLRTTSTGRCSWLSTTIVVGKQGLLLPTIWHYSEPLRSIYNSAAAKIIDHIKHELQVWLHGDIIHPVQLSSWLSLDEAHNLDLELVGISDECSSRLILWTPENVPSVEYPTPYFALSHNSPSHHDIAAILGLLRHVGPHEAGTDYVFERRIMSSIGMLFHSCSIGCVPGTDSMESSSSDIPGLYSLVMAGCSDLNGDVRTQMAELAHSTLEKLVKLHGHQDAQLPKSYFVYGLHVSKTMLSIFVHLPCAVSSYAGDLRLTECRQILIAQHRVAPFSDEKYYEYQDDRFFDRWQLLVALFTIRTHVRILEDHLSNSLMQRSRDSACCLRDVSVDRAEPANAVRPSPKISPHDFYFTGMREHWRGAQFPVPATWIPADGCIISSDRPAVWDMDIVALLTRHLASIYLYPLRRTLIPLSADDLRSNHLDKDYCGPDFLHRLHTPRRDVDNIKWLEVDDHQEDTVPHLNRLYDLLMMSTTHWLEINLFIASMFASFSEYSVQWAPKIRYPPQVGIQRVTNIQVDFALALQKIPATIKPTMERASRLPLTASSPGILVGLRSLNMNEDGNTVSQNEIQRLEAVMRPHLQILTMFLRYCSRRDGTEVHLPPWAILFCTYLKAGYVHVFAFSPEDCSPQFSVITTLVDRLPIARQCRDNEQLEDRMRLAMALFTLQRHVVRVCTHWDDPTWAQDGLIEEHEAVVQVTGISTPSPSYCDVPAEGETKRKRRLMMRLIEQARILDTDADYLDVAIPSSSEDSDDSDDSDNEYRSYYTSEMEANEQEAKSDSLGARVDNWRIECDVTY
ncbi:unnamed protein product [Somion occarium]|uniref:Uncharacterized protein n=1 Tax=Somion occarium TaxID=3059160 RepID=A0ABP1DGP1_9APHY